MASAFIDRQKSFLEKHLIILLLKFVEKVLEYAKADFYRGHVHLTHGALMVVADTLQIEMPKEVSL